MSKVTSNSLEQILLEKLSAEHVQATDTSDGCGQSFEVIVVSPIFEGKTLLQRHQLVNEAAKSEIAHLHAFSQKTYTPAQWKGLQK
ncbi:24485_t:CDS:2 [Entrophospora sp. SA101]|nr:8332_t:CDS:2 [Entrophospora sp. SA101]CAJ0767138.1 24485_t:CDS:2 [Entrophospora sp. SA101]CAJ0825440.1 8147_t:CDS:2 [Entrophospora sp. SA101]CAJ0845564.1 21226_t:CDS:2 [Entrophospora sp. SA101]